MRRKHRGEETSGGDQRRRTDKLRSPKEPSRGGSPAKRRSGLGRSGLRRSGLGRSGLRRSGLGQTAVLGSPKDASGGVPL